MSAPAEEYAANAERMSRDVQREANTELDIAYGPHEDQALDVYLPDAPGIGPLPVLLFIHGGAWSHGYKEWMGFMAPAITRLPAIFISVGYRLAPETRFPGPVEDCRNAVKWVYENISQRGGDPDRIFVGGHSSGGHLSSLITLQQNALRSLGLPDDVIKGCFPASGVFDVASPSRIETFLHSADDVTEASPVRQVAGNQVPFFIIVGENDAEEHRSYYHAMVEALGKERGPVESADIEGVNHYEISLWCGEPDSLWATTVRQWMNSPPTA
ncbi:MAG: alpha/beta hydrolase [Chloroflexi bacterium]|nr:alpha/beta hydrolase [Chloroflexota bacterium]